MSVKPKYKSLQEFREDMASRGLTPVLLQSIVREEGYEDCPSYLDPLIKKGIIDFDFVCVLLAKWEGQYDTWLEMGVQNEEMFCANQMPVRLVSIKLGKEKSNEVP